MIYVVSLYYPPVRNPPANRMGHLARILVERYGVESVRVVTGRPNYPEGKLPAEFKWKIFKRGLGENGERITHLYEYVAAFRGVVRKTMGLLSFAMAIFMYFSFVRVKKGDVVYVTSGPIFHVYALWLLSKFKNLPFIMDVRDLWPHSVAAMGHLDRRSWIYRSSLWLTNASHRAAVASVGNVDGIFDYIRDTVPEKPAHLIYNPVDTTLFRPLDDRALKEFKTAHADLFLTSDRTVFLYAGVHSVAMNLMLLMEALVRLVAKRDDFCFILIGYGDETERLKDFVRHNELANVVVFLPHMERDDLTKYICAADICYSSVIDDPIYTMCIPTKMTEYMACNKFVLSVDQSPFSLQAQERGEALVSAPGKVDELVSNMDRMLDHKERFSMSTNAREYIQKNHSVEAFQARVIACVGAYVDGSERV